MRDWGSGARKEDPNTPSECSVWTVPSPPDVKTKFFASEIGQQIVQNACIDASVDKVYLNSLAFPKSCVGTRKQ
jgi:hypothetical protein